MPRVPFRGLASQGIAKDPAPYQLDLSTFSDGANVRFHGGKVSRAPSFRTVKDALPVAPLMGLGVRSDTGVDALFFMGAGQVCYKLTGGTLTDVTPASYTPATTSKNLTATLLAQVVYLNDWSNIPFYYAPSSALFAALPGWDSTWRCRSLRAFGDTLVALNVTKGSNSYGNMVKWSDLALNGQPPASWDHTDPTKSAGESPLEDLNSPLVDGVPMRNSLLLYSNDEIWAMEPSSGDLVYTFRALFHTGGMIAPNCGVEVDGKHYVFGPNDIYVHDGTSKTSLVDGKNRRYIFGNLATALRTACRVSYLPHLNEVVFAFPIGASESAVPDGIGANKAFVIDLQTGAHSFRDLPNVTAITTASVDETFTYATVPSSGTYANWGGSYWDQQSAADARVVMLSAELTGTLTESRVLGYDFVQLGSLGFPLCDDTDYSAFVERTGLDLDDVGSDTSTSKLLTRIYPQGRTYGDTPITVEVATSDYPEGPYTWRAYETFAPRTEYKVDVKEAGRYLGIRFSQEAAEDFDLSGFDGDFQSNGSR